MMTSKRTLRKDTDVFLIGNYTATLPSKKLPSLREVFKVLFHYLRKEKLSLPNSITRVIDKLLLIWGKAKIPVRRKDHCISALKSAYEEWRDVQKNTNQDYEFQKSKMDDFKLKLDRLFDIAEAKALTTMTNKEDIEFLKSQRQEGRLGIMIGVDKVLIKKEENKRKREETIDQRKKRATEQFNILDEKLEFASSTSEDSGSLSCSESVDSNIPGPSSENREIPYARDLEIDDVQQVAIRQQRASKQILNTRLVSVLDKCKISDRNAVHLLTACAEAFGQDIKELILNRSSIRKRREQVRKEKAEKIKDLFKGHDLKATVVHWDGKLLPSLTGQDSVDRLPVIITSGELEQLLGVPALDAGSGRAQATAVFETLVDWGVQEDIKACCFDTTASNTGKFNGACILLEQLLERDLLYLACRHHIFEIIIKAVFELKVQITSGPNVAIFTRFKNRWPKLDKSAFETCLTDNEILNIFENDGGSLIKYLQDLLLEIHPRDDYRELIELSLVFLGEEPAKFSFRKPGAMNQARWMSKVIYCLKIFLFRKQFKLTKSEEKGIKEVSIFIVKLYVRAWFSAPMAISAPNFDFEFLKSLKSYENINSEISDAALKKFIGHLWYLSPETVGFSFFDDEVSDAVKEAMRQQLLEFENGENSDEEEELPSKRYILKLSEVNEFVEKGLEKFVGPTTKNFFQRFDLEKEFLSKKSTMWYTDEGYIRNRDILKGIKAVNDPAERGVKLITEYNDKLTFKEDQKQYIMQIVQEYCKEYPNCKKMTLS